MMIVYIKYFHLPIQYLFRHPTCLPSHSLGDGWPAIVSCHGGRRRFIPVAASYAVVLLATEGREPRGIAYSAVARPLAAKANKKLPDLV